VAQCLEYDIATQARDLDALLLRLDRTINAEFAACERDSKTPKNCITPAPNYYWELWDKRSINLERVNVATPSGQKIVTAALAQAA
jgi:hypothetical protein